jgi:HAE1 family hydrophobic/amphiphilic exporter-1
MNLPKLSVKRPVTTIMCVFIVLILGFLSFSKLPIDLLPKIEYPLAVVSTNYPNVGSEEVEKFVTKIVEEAVSSVEGIESVDSTSSAGNSTVLINFKWGTDMEVASQHIREKVDMIKGYLPEDAEDPLVIKIDPNAQAIMYLSVEGKKSLSDNKTFAEDNIKNKLERISGVASANISGGAEKEVEISVSAEKLEGYGLSISYISSILAAENINLPSGNVNKGNQELIIRTMGEFKSLEEIKEISIPLKSGGIISLKDIADVTLKDKEVEEISMVNGKRCLIIAIQKQSDANTVKVSKDVIKEVKALQNQYTDMDIEIVYDSSAYINQSIDNVKSIAIQGAVLAVIVLFIFLRNIRSTLIIGTAIPISIIATFVILYFSNITINLMTLGGLAMGIGMLVDSAIVVLENIYRFIQEGHSVKDAAVKGASEVSMSVVASTLTTVVVFLPIAFTGGITEMFFKELSLTIVFSISASLVVSLTLVPMLSSKLLKVDEIAVDMKDKRKKGVFTKIGDVFEEILKKIEIRYLKILKWALGHRKSIVFLVIGVFIVSMASLATVGAEFMPQSDDGWVMMNVKLPKGSSLKDSQEITKKVEMIIEKQNEVDLINTNIGTQLGMGSSDSSNSQILVRLKPLKERTRSVQEVADSLREEVRDIAGAEIKLSSGDMNIGGSPISLEIKGDDLDTLKELGNKFEKAIASVEGTREVKSSLGDGKPEVRIKLNRKKASQYGLTAAQISNQVKMIMDGNTATRYRFQGNEVDIVVKGDERYKQSISNLENVNIETSLGISIPLNLVADVVIETGTIQIERADQIRINTITSKIYGRDLKSITMDVEKEISKIDMPDGYSYEIGGTSKEMNEAFFNLILALVLAIVLVYMILASQFESLLNPFVIMFSVPLALAGGALGLFVTRRSISVPAILGVIILAGIVVNNAIVLIDYISIRRRMGEERTEAILAAGPTRLRPIFMTTATTALGLLPMALGIGYGAEMQAPMATVVIGGLLLSTFLTLVFIPVLYTLFDDLRNKTKRRKLKKDNKEQTVTITTP